MVLHSLLSRMTVSCLVHLQSMNNSGNVTENRQEDVDEEVGIATTFKKDTEGRKDDGHNDFADIATVRTMSAA